MEELIDKAQRLKLRPDVELKLELQQMKKLKPSKEMINKKNTGDDCPRCSQPETWDHVVKCSKTIEIRRQYVSNLFKEMMKANKGQIETREILDMIEDILVYLENGDPEEYETSQQYIGIDQLFQGFVVRDWKGSDFLCNKYGVLNKILVYHSVIFYKDCWKHRNEEYHDQVK